MNIGVILFDFFVKQKNCHEYFQIFTRLAMLYWRSRPTVYVTCVWAGVDSAWEQKKLEARKILINCAEFPAFNALFPGVRARRCVGQFFILHETMFLTTQFLIQYRAFQELFSSRQNLIDYEDRQTLKKPKA